MTQPHNPNADSRALEADPRTRAFDWAIVELWHWFNHDYAHKTTTDRAEIRIIEDTWVEIAERLEVWKNERTPPAGDVTDGDAIDNGGGE